MPTLGRPRIAILGTASSSTSSPASTACRRSSSTSRSSRSPVPSPWEAETGMGSPRPRALQLGRDGLVLGSIDLVGRDHHRTAGAPQQIRELGVARSEAGRAHPPPAGSRRRPRSPLCAWDWTARASSSESARSTPPVSIRSKLSPFHSHSSARRSRVTPGSASVTASRPPASRLIEGALPCVREADHGHGRAATQRACRAIHPTLPSADPSLPGQLRDLLDDLIRGEVGRVDVDRAVGDAQWTVRSRPDRVRPGL